MKRIGLTIVFLVLATNRLTLAQTAPEPLVLVGGYAGSWDTVLEISNPSSATLMIAVVADGGNASFCSSCESTSVELPPNGSARLSAKQFLGDLEGFRALRILAWVPGAPFIGIGSSPVVKARLVNRARPSQGTDLPITRLSSILSRETVLSFPSAVRSESAHSNLILTRVSGTGSLSFGIEVFDASGQQLASATMEAPVGASSISLVDVLGQLGITEVEGGQVRITQMGGTTLWGLLATAYDDGRIAVSPGKNP